MEAKKVKYDAISRLPDELLVKIISLLPTKRAASTSLLSTRWRTLFPLMMNNQLFASQHHIHLDESDLLYPKELEESTREIRKSFKSFVDKTLLSDCNNSSNMKKLTLKFRHDNISLDLIDQWIQKASDRGVVDLAMYLETTSKTFHHNMRRKPLCVFTNKTLAKLTLGYKFSHLLLSCSTVFLPVLKSLLLRGCEVLCNKFLTGCPILEELSVHFFDGLRELGISHKSLKRLTVHYNHNHSLHSYCLTDLATPSLVYLDYSGRVALKMANFLDSLVEAKLDVGLPQLFHPNYHKHISTIINWIYNVKTLYISSTFVKVVYTQHLKELPLFVNLVKLSFESDTEQGWEVLPHMLNKSPKLQTLLLKGLYCVRKEGVVCTDPKKVKVLEIYGFRGKGREFRTLKSFSCQVMKVQIKADDSKKLQVISRLLDLSECSSKCQINLL